MNQALSSAINALPDDACKTLADSALQLANKYRAEADTNRKEADHWKEIHINDSLSIVDYKANETNFSQQIKNLNKSVSDLTTDLNNARHPTFLGIPLPSRKMSFLAGSAVGVIGSIVVISHIK